MSADTFSANIAVSTKYIIAIIFCRGVSGQFLAPLIYVTIFLKFILLFILHKTDISTTYYIEHIAIHLIESRNLSCEFFCLFFVYFHIPCRARYHREQFFEIR